MLLFIPRDNKTPHEIPHAKARLCMRFCLLAPLSGLLDPQKFDAANAMGGICSAQDDI